MRWRSIGEQRSQDAASVSYRRLRTWRYVRLLRDVPTPTVLSKKLVHNESINISFGRMPERRRQTPEDLKSQRLPQPYSAFIRADHKIELHCAITARSGMPQRMFAHAPRNPSSRRCGTGHVAAIADVLAAAGLIASHVVSAQNHPVSFGYKCLFFRPHPIGQRLCFAHVRIERIGGGFMDDRKDDRSDSRGVAGFGFSDMHGSIVEIRGLCPQRQT